MTKLETLRSKFKERINEITNSIDAGSWTSSVYFNAIVQERRRLIEFLMLSESDSIQNQYYVEYSVNNSNKQHAALTATVGSTAKETYQNIFAALIEWRKSDTLSDINMIKVDANVINVTDVNSNCTNLTNIPDGLFEYGNKTFRLHSVNIIG
jgi:hypothetical protein